MANELLESFFTSVTSLKFSNFLFLFNHAGISTLLIPAVWRLNITYKLNGRPVVTIGFLVIEFFHAYAQKIQYST